jgi:hypothetical protein
MCSPSRKKVYCSWEFTEQSAGETTVTFYEY